VFLATYAYRWGNQKVRIGPMAQLGFATARVDLSAVTNTADAERSGSITKLVGTVGYDMDIHPTDRVNIYNNVGVFRLKRDRVLRGEVGMKYYLTRAFGVNVGYQFGRYKLVDDPNFIRVNEHGPLFGAVLRFRVRRTSLPTKEPPLSRRELLHSISDPQPPHARTPPDSG